MIIISQDKNTVVNFDNIMTISQENGKVGVSTHDDFPTIAKYKTEERAREVLQEIIQCYADIEILKMPNFKVEKSISSYELFERFVYEMPLE